MLDVSGVSGMSSDHRYHRIQFNTTTVAPYVGAMCLGKKLALTEYMHGAFDPLALDVKLSAPSSRTGNPLPACVETIKQVVELRGPKGGMGSSFFHNSTHDKSGVASPNWPEFIREVWAQGGRFWFSLDQGKQAYRQGWLAWTKKDDDTSARVVNPSAYGSRRDWKFDCLVFAESMAGT